MSDKALLKNMSWLTFVTGVERGAFVLQTILVARVLGITEYGMYGLLFGTIGFTASITGLHMGSTATVYVARYRETEKAKAAYVVQFVNRLGITLSLSFLLTTLPFADQIALWLIGPAASGSIIIAGQYLPCWKQVWTGGSHVRDTSRTDNPVPLPPIQNPAALPPRKTPEKR